MSKDERINIRWRKVLCKTRMKASGNGWEIQTFKKQPLTWPSWWRRQAYTLEMRRFKPYREHNEIPYVTWPGQPIRIEVTPSCTSRQVRDVPFSETMWIISRPSLDLARPWASMPRLARPEKMNGRTLPPQREDKDAGDVSKLVWLIPSGEGIGELPGLWR